MEHDVPTFNVLAKQRHSNVRVLGCCNTFAAQAGIRPVVIVPIGLSQSHVSR